MNQRIKETSAQPESWRYCNIQTHTHTHAHTNTHPHTSGQNALTCRNCCRISAEACFLFTIVVWQVFCRDAMMNQGGTNRFAGMFELNGWERWSLEIATDDLDRVTDVKLWPALSLRSSVNHCTYWGPHQLWESRSLVWFFFFLSPIFVVNGRQFQQFSCGNGRTYRSQKQNKNRSNNH